MKENAEQKGILGIDAGGTFTDLAFITGRESYVTAYEKIPTSHENILQTIEDGLDMILEQVPLQNITATNLATTFATNAIVEKKLRPAGLILIGYDPTVVAMHLEPRLFNADHVIQAAGGHDPKGNELEPLDIKILTQKAKEMLPSVESVAISSFFSVRNPSHELMAKNLIRSLAPDMHVTCGHELASDLDAILRAVTASLNAGLIPLMIDLFNSVEQVVRKKNCCAPIFVVRGDGSLVSAKWAKLHPIETILSGPAASAIGARHMAGNDKYERPAWVVDMGGTTTDIIRLDKDGKPEISQHGTTVAGHKTLVKSINIRTFGLGGDSRVRLGRHGELLIGPRRVIPLCSAASGDNSTKSCLEKLAHDRTMPEPIVVNFIHGAKPENEFESSVLRKIKNSPATFSSLLNEERMIHVGIAKIEKMEAKGLITFSGFTPTDALHVLKKLDKWDSKASLLGAKILANETGLSVDQLSERVCDKVVHDIALNIAKEGFSRANKELASEEEHLLSMALCEPIKDASRLSVEINAAIIGAGAPAWAFIPKVARLLGEKAVLPRHAEVAGAVGAAVGSFSLRYFVRITPMGEMSYRVHLPEGTRDFEELDPAVNYTREYMTPWIRERAINAGARNPDVNFSREDEIVQASAGRKVHLWTQLWFDVADKR